MTAIDRAALLALRSPDGTPLGPAWITTALTDITALGGHTVIALVTLAAAGFLALRHQPRVAALLLGAVAGGMALSAALKAAFARPRPDLVPQLAQPFDTSFPSGHAMLAAIAYLTLAALLARAEDHAPTRRYIIAVAATLVATIGFSRVWLGVHWPSDVLAGWLAGGAWAWGAAKLAARLQASGAVEPPE